MGYATKLLKSVIASRTQDGWRVCAIHTLVFLYQSAIFLIFQAVNSKTKIFLIKKSKLFRGLFVKVNFSIVNKTYNSLYHQNGSGSWDISSVRFSQENPNIFVSEEDDARYEWLERVAAKQQHDGEIIYLPSEIFRMVSEYYLSEYTGKWGVENTLDAQSQQEQLDYVLSLLFDEITDRYEPDVMVSPSLGDLQWRRAIATALSKGIPWVITEREGVIVPAVKEKYPQLVREAFLQEVDLLTTSNENHYEYWKDVGVDNSKLKLTGELKSDVWGNQQLSRTRREIHDKISEDSILLLYFAFGPTNYINEKLFPELKDDDEIQDDWTYLSEGHKKVLSNIAAEFEDELQIVIKGGHSNDFAEYNFDASNVLFLGGSYSAIQLIINADIIVGFQTTALTESMFTSNPIIYPAWGELHDSVVDQLIPYHETDAVTHAKSPGKFEETLRQKITSPTDLTVDDRTLRARMEFRSRYFHNVGSAGYRTYEAICSVVDSDSETGAD